MKTDKPVSAVCPLCGKPYSGVPALSRTDNQTPICPDCGIRQALESIGVSTEEREKMELFTLTDKLGGDIELAIKQLAENKEKKNLKNQNHV